MPSRCAVWPMSYGLYSYGLYSYGPVWPNFCLCICKHVFMHAIMQVKNVSRPNTHVHMHSACMPAHSSISLPHPCLHTCLPSNMVARADTQLPPWQAQRSVCAASCARPCAGVCAALSTMPYAVPRDVLRAMCRAVLCAVLCAVAQHCAV